MLRCVLLQLSDTMAMMIRLCVLPHEVSSCQTRSKKGSTGWFEDRQMQVLEGRG